MTICLAKDNKKHIKSIPIRRIINENEFITIVELLDGRHLKIENDEIENIN